MAENKHCPRCKLTKPLTEFYIRLGVVGGSSYCKECSKAFNKLYKVTPKGREVHRENSRRRWKKYRERAGSWHRMYRLNRKWKAVEAFGNKCQDCKQTYPMEVYDFHHLDPSQKEGNLNMMKSQKSYEAEIKKCILLCANCHRIRHIESDSYYGTIRIEGQT